MLFKNPLSFVWQCYGKIYIYKHSSGSIVEMCCETDLVSHEQLILFFSITSNVCFGKVQMCPLLVVHKSSFI